MKILQKYKKFYFNKLFIKKCGVDNIQTSRLFLNVSNKVKSSLLAMTLSINNLVRKREGRYYMLKVQMVMSENKLIHNELKNSFDIKE